METADLTARGGAWRGLFGERTAALPHHGGPIEGTDVAELEARLAAYTGARHCIVLGSGTEALAVAMMALDIGPGDEVITTPFAPAAALEAIMLRGATPVFVDIDRATCNIDPWLVDAGITARTRAIVPVSLYGQPANMQEINAIAQRHGLPVIEDASDSFGATYRGNKSCNLSTIGCTSFLADKPLGFDGNGGALFTRDDVLAQAVRDIRAGSRSNATGQVAAGEQVCEPLDKLQCAVLLANLARLDRQLAQRQRLAARYEALFSGRLQHVGRQRDRTSAVTCYTLVLEERERIMAELAEAGIAAAVHPLPLHLQLPYVGQGDPQCCPVAAGMAAMVMSLPIEPDLDEASVKRVAAAVMRAAGVALPPMDEW